MRREVIICDICGEEISKGDARIKAKIREPDSWANEGFWEYQKWKKLDICTHCLNEMSIYINGGKPNVGVYAKKEGKKE